MDMQELLTLSTPRPVFNRLYLDTGMLQADFEIQFKGKEYPFCKVDLTLYSYCIQTNKLENLIIRKKDTLNNTR